MPKVVKLNPCHENVIIRKFPEPTKTKSGIHLPPNSNKRSATGEIIAVGPGRKTTDGNTVPLDRKVGEIVIFNEHAGTPIDSVQGNEHLLAMRELDVMVVKEVVEKEE